MNDKLLKALTRINAAYGTGDIISVTIDADNTSRGYYHVQRQYGCAKYRWTIKGNSVHSRKHQRKLS